MNRLVAWRAAGREIAVAGLGRSGVAAARLLASHGIRCYASDAGTSEATADAARALVAGYPTLVHAEAGTHDLGRIAHCAALVLSPGIPPEAPAVRAALDAGIPVIAEAQLGLDALGDVPYVAVTGTNGKTTTTALIDHLFRAAGRDSLAAGNIGTPLTAVALREPRPHWLAVELSSFQLHDTPDVMPAVGVLTNLAPDHLDRYPSLGAYYADKARLFANATTRSIWVGNLDDADSRAMLGEVTLGRHLRFSTEAHADAWYDRAAGMLVLAGAPLLPRRELPLLGDHNVANALAASLAVHATGVGHGPIADGLRTFRALTHRMEPVREVDGVVWINDSKATNIASTLVAVAAMDRPFVLLLGGRHKGEPYTVLREALRARAVAVVAYGEAGDLVERDLGDAVRVVRATEFREVLAAARALAPAGGAVLLSPACSSYDMFDNYEQRGALFRALVEAM
ncbi:MAG TPA: UDP-N-acetylmuramoyl-L-alanine--D-glutamate ligase [Gemmatimonadales bacterium]|nr:UDP-N-acetylmuramoyl-L-alanine--D-glutamate ligase [Gemmatimonadales bacterium]